MKQGDYLALAWVSLRANRLRSSLTLLGITIGIASVILLASVGAGTRQQVLTEFNAQAGNMILILPHFDQSGKPPSFLKQEDVTALRQAMRASMVVPLAMVRLPLWHRGRQYFPTVSGTTDEYLAVQRLRLRAGRFLTPGEELGRARVCVLGGGTADRLFGVTEPAGAWLRLGGERFRVVGVIAPKGGEDSLLGMARQDRLEIFMPAATALALGGLDEYFMVMIAPSDPNATAATVAVAKTVLARLHGPKARFEVLSTEQILRSLATIATILTALLVAVGAISLVVGGIGIMNIMLVSVTERTREIGIRKSVGAKRGDILSQFLTEAVFLCLCGGLLGIVVGIAGTRIVAATTPVKPLLCWWIFLLAVGFSTAVGVLFGTYPAWQAARLDPIAALRHE